jgi:hypothetical protein
MNTFNMIKWLVIGSLVVIPVLLTIASQVSMPAYL